MTPLPDDLILLIGGKMMDENERMQRQERAWIGLVTTICLGLLLGSMFLLSLYFRVTLPV